MAFFVRLVRPLTLPPLSLTRQAARERGYASGASGGEHASSGVGIAVAAIAALTFVGWGVIYWANSRRLEGIRQRLLRSERPEWAEINVYRAALGVDPRTALETSGNERPLDYMHSPPPPSKTILEQLKERNPNMTPALEAHIAAVLAEMGEQATNAYRGMRPQEGRPSRPMRVVF